MNPEKIGIFTCLVIVMVVAAVRLPALRRDPRARASWAALATGATAFVAAGGALPLEIIDSWIGGANYINLLQNSLAVFAFWLFLHAVEGLETGTFSWHKLWQVPTMIVTFALPFVLVTDRQPTTENFINEYANQWALWAYATIYMSWVIVLSARAVEVTRDRRAFLYLVLRSGCYLVCAGSVAEIIYLTLRVAGQDITGRAEAFRILFPPLFYGGVALIAASMGGFWTSRIVRSIAYSAVIRSTPEANETAAAPTPMASCDARAMDAYRSAIALADLQHRPQTALGRVRQYLATRFLDGQVNAPRVVAMTIQPNGTES